MQKRPEIKGIVFDLGGVLVGSFTPFLVKSAGKKLGVSSRRLRRVIRKEIPALERGEETSLKFWHRVCDVLGIRHPSDKILRTLWIKQYKEHAKIKKEMVGLVKGLRKNYIVAILSNTIQDHSRINRKRRLFEYFDEVLLSDEVGLKKPERKFFGEVAKRLGIPLKNLIFTDDKLRWVEAARKYGLRAVLFKNRKQFEVALKRKGVLWTQK
jgi:HAD superfamily hydrolase (TIGR01509 family)